MEANDPDRKANGNYWIRTWKASCFGFPGQYPIRDGYERTGIVRYGDSKRDPRTEAWPRSKVSLACSDETYTSLKPIFKWNINWTSDSAPANDKVNKIGEVFDVQGFNRQPNLFPLASFALGRSGGGYVPMQIDYSNPTFFKLNYTGSWNPPAVIIPENYSSTDRVSFESERRKCCRDCGLSSMISSGFARQQTLTV